MNFPSCMLLEISGEITPEKIKRQCQSKTNIQLWIWLVMEVKFNAVNNDTSILTSSYFISFKIAVNNTSFFFKRKQHICTCDSLKNWPVVLTWAHSWILKAHNQIWCSSIWNLFLFNNKPLFSKYLGEILITIRHLYFNVNKWGISTVL